MTELVQVQVVEHYSAAEGKTRGRWVWHSSGALSVEQATELVRLLKDTYGAARATCSAFEVVALRHSFGLKLIGPALPCFPELDSTRQVEPIWVDPMESALASHEGRS